MDGVQLFQGSQWFFNLGPLDWESSTLTNEALLNVNFFLFIYLCEKSREIEQNNISQKKLEVPFLHPPNISYWHLTE